MDKLATAFSIINVFEEFLEEKNIHIENPEKRGVENPAIIYGEDYYNLEDKILKVMKNK